MKLRAIIPAVAALAALVALYAQQPPSFTAATEGVAKANIRIELQRWSTDAERDQLLAAWTGQSKDGATKAKGKGKGKAKQQDDTDPFGSFGRASRNGNNADAPAPAVTQGPSTPEEFLTEALGKVPTLGYIWSSNETAGYPIRYAARLGGDDRIVLLTASRLGRWNENWTVAAPGPGANYEFTAIEVHLGAKGEAKISASGKLAVDAAAKTISLENYAALPVTLKDVRKKP
jgi:hypothetical protein